MLLQVLTQTAKSLRESSKEVRLKDLNAESMQTFFDSLIQTMIYKNGVGIAAPQVGKNIRALAIVTTDGPKIYVNPIITKRSIRKARGEEGCLSVPGIYGYVERYAHVDVSALNRYGESVKVNTTGFFSIIFQHEIDHLDGILFTDRTKKFVENGSNQI